MPVTVARGKTDEAVESIRSALDGYLAEHPRSQIALYRHNPVSVRIRVIDPAFAEVDKSVRHAMVWQYLESLPEDVQSDVSMVVLLAPGEEEASLSNHEFDHPSRSIL